MNTVYLVQHLHVFKNEEENIKTIGIYSSEINALKAIDTIKKQPGFSSFPDRINPLTYNNISGFYIDKYEIDQDHWQEGFII